MPADQCTWCGHPRHAAACPLEIMTASGPSGGRKVTARPVDCPCGRHLWHAEYVTLENAQRDAEAEAAFRQKEQARRNAVR